MIIITGRDRGFLDKLFENFPIHIIAEHGTMIRYKGLNEWILNDNYEVNWKDTNRPILDLYAKWCPGAFVE